MDKEKQEVTPVSEQQSVKISNNLSFARTLAYGFAVVSVGISIAVGGYLLGANKTKLQPTPQTSVIPTVSPTPDPTANWKTYTNSKSNFTFKYPLDWDVAQLDSSLATPSLIVAPKVNVDALRKVNFQVGGGKSNVVTINGPYSSSSNFPVFVSDTTKSVISKPVIIAGLSATEYMSTYKVDLPGVQSGDIVINSIVGNNDNKYSLGLVDIKYKDIYYQIISTFNFTK